MKIKRSSGAQLLFMLVCVAGSGRSFGQANLQITSPASGTVVYRGQQVTVAFQADPSVSNIALSGGFPGGWVSTTSSPGTFVLTIPSTLPIDTYQLGLVGTVSGQPVFSSLVSVVVDTPLSISSVSVSPKTLTLSGPGEIGRLMLTGILSDSSSTLVTHSPQISYSSSNPSMATVDATGAVTGVSPGSAFINIAGAAVPYSVHVSVQAAQVPTPTFSPVAGPYPPSQTITITDTQPNVSIYYTTDGTAPTSNSTPYTSPLSLTSSGTVNAIALANGYSNSLIGSAAYVIEPPAATPAFSVLSGTYTSVQTITINDSTPSATIYYTTDGSTPTTSSTAYSGAITVSESETINAIAVASGYLTSAVASAAYTINLPPPSFTFAASPTSLTMGAGGTGTSTLTVTPQNGFNSAVSFGCSGLPAGASCAFSPATVTPSGSAATTTLTITAPATSAAVRSFGFGMPVLAVAFVGCFFGWRRRSGLERWLLLAMVAAGMGMLSGCSGGGSGGSEGSGGGSTPTTSTVTVNATSGTLAQSMTISLTVN